MKTLLRRTLPRPIYQGAKRVYLRLAKTSAYYETLHRKEFFRRAFHALAYNRIDGDYFEFGCFRCETFRMAHQGASIAGHACRLYAFDSFGGLPAAQSPEDEHPRWIEGSMSTGLNQFHTLCRQGRIPRRRYDVVPGLYSQSLTGADAEALPRRVCMAYIDCDLYSSTQEALEFLAPRLRHGMILAFDDYYCYSPDRDAGERAACVEFFEKNPQWALVPYIQIGWHGMSFIVYDAKLARHDTDVRP